MGSIAVVVFVVGIHKAIVAVGMDAVGMDTVGMDTDYIVVEEAALAVEQANSIEFHNCHRI